MPFLNLMDLMKLLREYGTVKNIPETDLDRIGLEKKVSEEDGNLTYRVVQKGFIPIKVEKKIFDKLEFNLEHKIGIKKLDYSLINKLKSRIKGINEYIDQAIGGHFGRGYYQREGCFHFFWDLAKKYINEKLAVSTDSDLLWIVQEKFRFGLTGLKWASSVVAEEIPNECENLLSKCYEDLCNQGNVSLENLIDVSIDLQRASSKILDRHILQKWRDGKDYLISRDVDDVLEIITNEYVNDSHPLKGSDIIVTFKQLDDFFGDSWRNNFEPETVDYLESKLGEAHVKLVYDTLKNNGFDDVVAGFSRDSPIDDVVAYLNNVGLDNLPDYDKMNKLCQGIKVADVKDKINYSQEIKRIKAHQKHNKKIINGAIEFLTPENSFINWASKEFKEIDKLISHKKDYSEILTLSGVFDKEADADPGKISGDCTQGKPLPFYDPNLHNVKVYLGKKHLGNIYLFETTVMQSEEKVWHLDAIQIPYYADWGKSIGNLVESLAGEARKNGIDKITVNKKNHDISNYDYISEAVIKYHENLVGGTMAYVDKDDGILEDYSNLQGSAVCRVIWSN